MTFAVKTAGDPLSLTSAVRGALNGLDRELPVFDTQTMDAADGEVAGQPHVAGGAVAQLRRASRCSCRRSASTACSRIS